jgi:hypothetical protein
MRIGEQSYAYYFKRSEDGVSPTIGADEADSRLEARAAAVAWQTSAVARQAISAMAETAKKEGVIVPIDPEQQSQLIQDHHAKRLGKLARKHLHS